MSGSFDPKAFLQKYTERVPLDPQEEYFIASVDIPGLDKVSSLLGGSKEFCNFIDTEVSQSIHKIFDRKNDASGWHTLDHRDVERPVHLQIHRGQFELYLAPREAGHCGVVSPGWMQLVKSLKNVQKETFRFEFHEPNGSQIKEHGGICILASSVEGLSDGINHLLNAAVEQQNPHLPLDQVLVTMPSIDKPR